MNKIKISRKFDNILYLLKKIKVNYKYIFQIIIDLINFRKDTNKFRKNYSSQKINKSILIIHYDDSFIYEYKLLGYLVQGLKKEGWEIKVLLKNKLNIIGISYYKCFGIDNFIFFDNYNLSNEEKKYCRELSGNFLSEELSLPNIKKWTFENVWIGPQIFSSLSRNTKEGSINFKDPKIINKISNETNYCIENILKARKLFKSNKANYVLTNEINNNYFGPIVDTAINMHKEVIIQQQPWKDDGLILRKVNKINRREHPSSISKKSLIEIFKKEWTIKEEKILNKITQDRYSGKYFLQSRNQINTIDYDLTKLREKYNLDKDKKIAVIFSQVLWDANLFYGEDLFNDAADWFINTIEAATKNKNINWLVKLHPANVWKRNMENINTEMTELIMIRNKFGTLPPNVKIIFCEDNISTLSLLRICDYGVTIRGTSGLEISTFGKPCITGGTGRYSHLGFTIDSNNKEDYLNKIKNIHLIEKLSKKQTKLAKWCAYTTFDLRIFEIKGVKTKFKYIKRGSHPFQQNLFIKNNFKKDLDSNKELNKFAKWVQSDNIDFLK